MDLITRELVMKRSAWIVSIVILLVCSLFSTNATATTVLGPLDLTPQWYRIHLSRHSFEADPSLPSTLTITKNSPNRSYRTGFIRINRTRFRLKSFLQGNDTIFKQDLSLKENNRLVLFFWGEPNTSLSISIDQAAPVPAPTINFSAQPASIELGASSTLSWSVQSADTVAIEPGIGTVASEDSLSVSPTEMTIYTLTASGPGGTATAAATVTVTLPPPTATIDAVPTGVELGEQATLEWSSTFADTCTIEPDIGAVDCNGASTVTPAQTTNYLFTATGPGGTATSEAVVTVVIPPEGPALSFSADPQSIAKGESTQLSWDSANVETVHIDNGIGTVAANGTMTVWPKETTTYTITGSGPEGTVSESVTVTVTGQPEPQPEGSFGETYNDLIPQDATVESYDENRFSLITGKVLDMNDAPLADVSVTIHNHAEYGTVLTDEAGNFSIPVEGGGHLTVVYRKKGFIDVHRQVQVGWNDYGIAEAIRMLPVDTAQTEVVFDGNAETVTTHTATEITDEIGSRAASMVFTGDNQAFLLDEDGNDVMVLESVIMRATEYTTPESMPAKLPPNSGFTYCSEMQIDGAERVRFDKPVPLWVDNFLGFEVGTAVPVGYYDRDRGLWVPLDNGVVVRLLDTDSDGIVDALDADGDDLPDDLNDNGNNADEVVGLSDSVRFSPDKTFWRAVVKHFSPIDLNWPIGPPAGARTTNANSPDPNPMEPKIQGCSHTNSYVTHKNRTFHEDIPIPGTNLKLHYSSNRVKGYQYVISVPASAESVPDSLKSIIVKLEIGGQAFEETLQPDPDQVVDFIWDGLDFLGNEMVGTAIGKASVGYVYDAVYYLTGNFPSSFGQNGTGPTDISASGKSILWKVSNVSISAQGAKQEFGNGWSLSNHHRLLGYNLLQRGNGSFETVSGKRLDMITTIAGNGESGYSGDGGSAIAASFGSQMRNIAVDASGNIFIADADNQRIRKVDSEGIITTVAGNGAPTGGYSGEGGPAVDADISFVEDVAVDANGNLFLVSSRRILKVDTNGIITTVVGTGEAGYSGDNGPATEAKIGSFVDNIALDYEGNLYFGDNFISDYCGHSVIRKVDTNGIITTIVGNGTCGRSEDNIPANSASLLGAESITFDLLGNMYFIENVDHRIRKVDTSGVITTVVADLEIRPNVPGGQGYYGDNGPAVAALINYPGDIAIGKEGALYIVDNGVVRKVDNNGIITTIAGIQGASGYSGDNGPAADAQLSSPNSVAIDEDGEIYIVDKGNRVIRKMVPSPLAEKLSLDSSDQFVNEVNGGKHIFSETGYHLRTIDAHTSKELTIFTYDDNERLSTIEDRFANTITIERDANGKPTAIISPYGHRTELTINENGNLIDIIYEDDSAYHFEYTIDDLMTAMTSPRDLTSTHDFDDTGRVVATQDPENGTWALDRENYSDGSAQSTITSGENNTIAHLDTIEPGDVYRSETTSASGETSTFVSENQGILETRQQCGMTTETYYNLDAKSKRKIPETIVTLSPGGLTHLLGLTKTYTEDLDGLTLKATTKLERNDKETTEVVDYQTGTATVTSPLGRITSRTFDLNNLLVTDTQTTGLLSTHFDYDTHGRLTLATTGDRSVAYGYDARGNLETVVDSLDQTTRYSHDLLGRVTRIERPDLSTVDFQYDPSGNMTILTTPKPADNQFEYNGNDQVSGFTSPLNNTITYSYDKERKLTAIGLPSGKAITNTYTHGRLSQTATDEWATTYTYHCAGLTASITRGSEQINYTYDGTLLTGVAQTGTLNADLALTYNNDLNPTSLTYAGLIENFGYDDDGLLISAGDFTITRNADNGLPEAVTAGGFAVNRTFNGYGEIDTLDVNLSGNHRHGYELTRDNSGRISTKIETINGVATRFDYAYDELSRLRTVKKDNALVEEYQYDDNGNRTSVTNIFLGIAYQAYAHTDADHVITAGPASYSFNADGYLASKTEGAQTTTYTYSSTGELMNVTLPDGNVVAYVHDPLGRRIAKKINGAIVEKYLWSGRTTLLAVYDGSNNLLQRYQYADGRMPLAMTAQGSTYYLTYDQVGSLRLVIDSTGAIVKRVDYDSFGNIISDSNTNFAVPFGFAGGLHDRNTGLVRFGYRDYMPDIGKWTAKDPILFAGGDLNLYGYVQNNSINRIDPFGLLDFNTVKDAVNVISIVDVLPIGAVPGTPQIIGEVVDVVAVAGTQGVLLSDLSSQNITTSQFAIATTLNAGNFIIGTAGNVLSGPGNIVLSAVEGVILYTQYLVTKPQEKECDKN